MYFGSSIGLGREGKCKEKYYFINKIFISYLYILSLCNKLAPSNFSPSKLFHIYIFSAYLIIIGLALYQFSFCSLVIDDVAYHSQFDNDIGPILVVLLFVLRISHSKMFAIRLCRDYISSTDHTISWLWISIFAAVWLEICKDNWR